MHPDLSQIFNIVGDKTRYKLFKLLTSKRELCVSELASETGVTASAVSQHLNKFESLNMVRSVRHGQRVCYAVNKDNKLVDDLRMFVNKHGGVQ